LAQKIEADQAKTQVATACPNLHETDLKMFKQMLMTGGLAALVLPGMAMENGKKECEAEGREVGVSSFCESLVPGKFILPAKEGWWNWGMAPIYDENGKLHIFNSCIPYMGKKGMGYWQSKSIINHYVADSVEGPYELLGTVFSSDEATYHNPQISKVGDTYVLVFLWKPAAPGSLQSIGIATAKSLDGPWTESPLNPIIKPIEGTPNAAHASNPTFLVDQDGKFRIYYKSMAEGSDYREISLAVSDRIEGPYVNHSANPLISYRELGLDIEDPYAFFYNDTYYMIVEDRMAVKNALEGNPISENKIKRGGSRPGLFYASKDGIQWGRPEIGYLTDEQYFGRELSRSERPHILWKEGKPEYLFLANHGSNEAGYYLKVEGWTSERSSEKVALMEQQSGFE
jgi:hypothetical protein